MFSSLKSLVFKILCNNVTGKIIYKIYSNEIPDVRWKHYRFSVRQGSVNGSMIAAIFWGFYESAEIRFIEKYLNTDSDIIELGGSIGIVSSHIASKLKDKQKMVIVEANPFLVDTIMKNVRRHRKTDFALEVVNAAIGYNHGKLKISVTDNNTESRVIATGAMQDAIEVEAVTLNAIHKKYSLSDYTLVSDIEGSEAEVLLNETDCLRACRQIIIELHDTSYNGNHYTIEDLRQLIERKHGFHLIDQSGPVYFFKK